MRALPLWPNAYWMAKMPLSRAAPIISHFFRLTDLNIIFSPPKGIVQF